MDQDVIAYLPVYRQLQGWFAFTDLVAFDALLDAQVAAGTTGDFLEIGVMHGKSAMFLSRKCAPGERLLLCDLFETPPPMAANAEENGASYPGVTRAAFNATAARLAVTAPTVLQMPSGELGPHITPGSIRFAHVDGGHLYPEVSADVELSQQVLLEDDGWVVFDDYRTAHAPGVAAAVWGALATGPLVPMLLTSTKLYAARNPKAETARLLAERMSAAGFTLETQHIRGRDVVRVVEDLEVAPYRRPAEWRGYPVIDQGRAAAATRLLSTALDKLPGRTRAAR